ncbi:MAG: hypothetical protein C4560_13450 [Nitrospiraceae bacterium]|nr:MAG: hypothetical protein C4560_13450 [Nitrospiraceae bacterium]
MKSKKRAFDNVRLFFVLSFLIVFASTAHADYQTMLSFSGYIQNGTGNLDSGDYSAPVVFDWDDDGKKDLLAGTRIWADNTSNGYVSFYQNIGEDNSPSFSNSDSNYIQACSNTCLAGVPGADPG